MYITYTYNKEIETLLELCKTLANKDKLRILATNNFKRCYIVTNEGERWTKLEEIANKMIKKLTKLEKDFDKMHNIIKDLEGIKERGK